MMNLSKSNHLLIINRYDYNRRKSGCLCSIESSGETSAKQSVVFGIDDGVTFADGGF